MSIRVTPSVALIALIFALNVSAKPSNDFFFPDREESESDVSPARLEDQLLPWDESNVQHGSTEENEENFEDGEYFHGDIVLNEHQREHLLGNGIDDGSTRTGRIDEYYRWPKNSNGTVIMPYNISLESKYSKK